MVNRKQAVGVSVFMCLLILGIWFDDLNGPRAYTLLSLSGFLLVAFVVALKVKHSRAKIFTYLVLFTGLALLDNQSRYIVNFLFHSLYFVVLLAMMEDLSKKWFVGLGVYGVGASLVKVVYLLEVSPSVGNLIQAVFLAMVGTFVLVTLILVKEVKLQNQQKDALIQDLSRAHDQVKTYADQVEALTMIKERQRLSRDIHDSLGHYLVSALMTSELVMRKLEDKDLISQMTNLKATLQEGLKSTRSLVAYTREGSKPYTNQDLKDLVHLFGRHQTFKPIMTLDLDLHSLNLEVNLVIYRMVQESLTNCAKHAKATVLVIHIEKADNGIHITIRDDGQEAGQSQTGGHGLRGMAERVHLLGGHFKTYQDQGFVIEANLPVEESYD